MVDFELILMTVTLFTMFTATVAKAVTARLIGRLEKKIAEGNRARAKVEGQLKMVQAQSSVMAKNKVALEKKKAKLLKKLDKMATDLESLSEAANYRLKLSAKMRGGLIKATRAAPRPSDN